MALPLRLVRGLARTLVVREARVDAIEGWAYRTGPISEARGAWEARILELSDGRTIREIVETLFREESQAGGWVADIGMCRSVFARELASVIESLAQRGILRLDRGTPACLRPSKGP